MIWSMSCGAYTLFAIEDGWFYRDPVEQFPESDRAAWDGRRLEEGMLRVSMGCFLLTDGNRSVMIDTGIGNLAATLPGNAVGGQLPQALALIGVRPETVQTVVHTHLHLDHIGGNLAPTGQPFFPSATFHIHRAELDYWLHADDHPAAGAVQGIVQRFIDDGRVEPIEGEQEVAPGLTAVETPGHTPGHLSFTIVSQGSRTFVTGDVTHHPLQVEHPEWGVAADHDPRRARASRERVFELVAGTGMGVAAGHYPRPGMGYVEVVDDLRTFVTGTPVQVA